MIGLIGHIAVLYWPPLKGSAVRSSFEAKISMEGGFEIVDMIRETCIGGRPSGATPAITLVLAIIPSNPVE